MQSGVKYEAPLNTKQPSSFSKRLASATLQLTLSNAAVRLLALVSMPLLTRLLSPEAYGAAAMVSTLISLTAVIAISGMDMSYARAYHAKESPSGKVVEVFAWRYTINTGLLAGTLAALAWWLFIAQLVGLPPYLATFLGVGIFLSVTNSMSQTRARLNNQIRSMSLAIIASAIGTLALSIGIAIWWRQDELPLVISITVGYLIPVLILGIPDLRQLRVPSGLCSEQRIQVLKIGIAGIMTAPMYWVISSLDRWFLGYFEDSASVGIYSIGYSVAIMGVMVNTALAGVWVPEVSRAFENDPEKAQIQISKLIELMIVALGVVWLAITSAGGDVVRLLADKRFFDAATVVPYIAGAVFFHGILHLYSAGTLLKKKLHHTLPWWVGGAVICIIMNFLLVPGYGRLGAAITQACALAFTALGIAYSAQKLFPLKLRTNRVLVVLLAILAAGVLMQRPWSQMPLVSLALKFPVGVLLSLIVLNVMWPKFSLRKIVGAGVFKKI